jgi:hypothetical protein
MGTTTAPLAAKFGVCCSLVSWDHNPSRHGVCVRSKSVKARGLCPAMYTTNNIQKALFYAWKKSVDDIKEINVLEQSIQEGKRSTYLDPTLLVLDIPRSLFDKLPSFSVEKEEFSHVCSWGWGPSHSFKLLKTKLGKQRTEDYKAAAVIRGKISKDTQEQVWVESDVEQFAFRDASDIDDDGVTFLYKNVFSPRSPCSFIILRFGIQK